MTMEKDFEVLLAKMREIADREGLHIVNDEAKLQEAATKELLAERQKCADCEGKGDGEKCGNCSPALAVEVAPAPLAGATTFDEADKFDEAQEVEDFAYRLQSRFRRIVDNIFSSDATLAEKAGAVKAAAGEMEERLGKPPEPGNWFGRVKEWVTGVPGSNQASGDTTFHEGLGDKATKTEDGKAFPASDYAYVPDATKPSTWKLRLTLTPGGKPDARIVGAAVAALGKGFRGQKVQIPSAALAGVKAKVRSAWRKANPDKKAADIPAAIKETTGFKVTETITTEAPGGFRTFKDTQGNWRWMTLTSNIWRDRDGEIIPAAAHEENVAHAESTKDMPELRLWHVPGSRVGVADWADFAHGFLLHSGGFDKGMEGVAESLAACEEPLGVSHGFYYEKEDGSDTYSSYRDFEVSVLPLERAANPWTEFTADNMKEVAMGLTDERRGFLVEHMGENQVVALEKLLEEKEQDLKDGKVDFKEVLADAIEATPAPATKPAEGKGEAGHVGLGDEVALAAQLTKLIEGVSGKVDEIATAQAEQGEQIKALQASDDEKIAALMHPSRQPPAAGERPTEDKDNEVKPEDKGINPNEADDGPKTPGEKALNQIARIA